MEKGISWEFMVVVVCVSNSGITIKVNAYLGAFLTGSGHHLVLCSHVCPEVKDDL